MQVMTRFTIKFIKK